MVDEKAGIIAQQVINLAGIKLYVTVRGIFRKGKYLIRPSIRAHNSAPNYQALRRFWNDFHDIDGNLVQTIIKSN